MTRQELTANLKFYYDAAFTERPAIEMNDRMYAGLEEIPEETMRRHIKWMCLKGIRFVAEGGQAGFEKALVWLGYIQGELRAMRKFCVNELRAHNRMGDVTDHPCCKMTTPVYLVPGDETTLVGGYCPKHGRSILRTEGK